MSQTTRNLVLLLALTAVASGLSLYAYFGVQKADEKQAEEKEITDKVFALQKVGEKPADGGHFQLAFTHLTVKAKGETTVLEKGDDGNWRIVQPVQARADRVTVDTVLSQVQTAKMKAQVEEKPDGAALKKYGLDSPQFQVTVRGYVPDEKGGGREDPSRIREMTLYGGIDNPFDGSVYVRRGGDEAVWLAEGGLRWSLEKTSYDLRDKEVLALDEGKIRSIEVKSPTHAYVLERDDKKRWHFLRPFEALADASAIETMLRSLRTERAIAFPSDSPEALGLSKPHTEARLVLESGEVVRLSFAALKADAGERMYLLREEGPSKIVAEVNPSAAGALDRNPTELKDKSVLLFERDQVARLSFRLAGGQEIVVERSTTDGGVEEWAVLSPEKGPAKRWKMTSILWALGSLKAAQFGEVPKKWEKYGIDDRSRAVTALDRDGKVLAQLVLGNAVAGKDNLVYAKGSRPEVAEIDQGRLSDLPQSLADLLDRAPVDGGA